MKNVLMLVGLLMMSGCFTTKMHYGGINPMQTETKTRLQHTFLWGLVSPGSTDLARVCGGSQVVGVKSQIAGFAVLATWFTGGLYAPVTVSVTCAK